MQAPRLSSCGFTLKTRTFILTQLDPRCFQNIGLFCPVIFGEEAVVGLVEGFTDRCIDVTEDLGLSENTMEQVFRELMMSLCESESGRVETTVLLTPPPNLLFKNSFFGSATTARPILLSSEKMNTGRIHHLRIGKRCNFTPFGLKMRSRLSHLLTA